MSWTLFATTFLTIFIAELGDKTQLAAFALSSGSGSRWTIFVASSLALVATTGIAVLAGGVVGKYVPELWLRRLAGVVFLILGLVVLIASFRPPTETNAAQGDSVELRE